MAKKKEQEIASEIIRGGFNLQKFKQGKGLSSNSIKFKDQEWIPVSKAFQDRTTLPGIPTGHVTLIRGYSDTGKTTLLLEAATSAQRMGIIPVLIITEMKWSWSHARDMGFQFEEVVDEETGEILDYKGDFIYVDRSTLNSIEDVAAFMHDLMDEQNKGNLPAPLCFFWDSIGSIPCDLSIKSNKSNNEWNGSAMSTQFGNGINQKILLSRKESSKYVNTFVAINKVWTAKPDSPMGQPKLENKGGKAMWYDASLIITFGNITNSGTSKIKAVNKGREFEFAKRTKVQIEKNHLNGLMSRGSIIMTQHGFIDDDKKAIDKYKEEHKHSWTSVLGSTDFTVYEEPDVEENVRDILTD